ncbi:antigen WC1.1-like [Bos indicus]|uniref:Antigen WC1.1-like n=1 Tax=Bos indicus TaxID=9915 RepID=A0ABM4SAR2_BOSIN
MALGTHLSLRGLCVLLLGTMVGGQGNHTQVLLKCNDSVSEPAGSAASEESVPYCPDSRQLRLVDGGVLCAGRVEILDQGSWGTICDDGWDLADARVVCRIRAHLAGRPELHRKGVPRVEVQDAGVICSRLRCTLSTGWEREFLALRMVSEDHQCAGWLEVFYNGTWGSVCCSPMEDITVSMICRQLGCGDTGTLNSSGNGSTASASEESAPNCSDSRQLCLVDRGGPCAGRVEILHQGSWGTICDDSWDLDGARLVCRQLGCGEVLSAVESAPFGAGSIPIWLDHVYCERMESHVWQCPSQGRGRHNCGHEEDAGVICSDSRQLRLVDGGGHCAGRVEILDQGSWGTICDDGWDLDYAHVVCRQLGCGQVLNATSSAHFGAGSGPIWLDDLNCTGKESHV